MGLNGFLFDSAPTRKLLIVSKKKIEVGTCFYRDWGRYTEMWVKIEQNMPMATQYVHLDILSQHYSIPFSYVFNENFKHTFNNNENISLPLEKIYPSKQFEQWLIFVIKITIKFN